MPCLNGQGFTLLTPKEEERGTSAIPPSGYRVDRERKQKGEVLPCIQTSRIGDTVEGDPVGGQKINARQSERYKKEGGGVSPLNGKSDSCFDGEGLGYRLQEKQRGKYSAYPP